MSYILIGKSQLVSLVVPAGNTSQSRFNFADQPQLRNVVIDACEVLTVNDMAVDPNNIAVIPATVMQRAYVTLFVSNVPGTNAMGEYINQMPMTLLHRQQNNQTGTNNPYVRDLFNYGGRRVDWAKSYVQLGGALGIDTQVTFLFNIYYRDMGALAMNQKL